jgi:acetyltransferase
MVSGNMPMLRLARNAGFRPHPSGESGVTELVLDLHPPAAS